MPESQKVKSFDLSSFRYDPLKRGANVIMERGGRGCNAITLPKPRVDSTPASEPISYPTSPSLRATYINPTTQKPLTAHQWAVYDLTLRIPHGKITTYKEIALALRSGSPRSVGSALRNNPFAPYVPCHRVIASNLFVGGFFGEWTDLKKKSGEGNVGNGNMTEEDMEIVEEGGKLKAGIERNWHLKVKGKGSGMVQREKMRLLAMEGVPFSAEGKLVGGEEFVWRPSTEA